jgi:hypothetical protein
MRLLVATLTIGLLAFPAYAQNAGSMGGKGRNSSRNTEQQKADQEKGRPPTTLTRLG